jgi:hypothetical protein
VIYTAPRPILLQHPASTAQHPRKATAYPRKQPPVQALSFAVQLLPGTAHLAKSTQANTRQPGFAQTVVLLALNTIYYWQSMLTVSFIGLSLPQNEDTSHIRNSVPRAMLWSEQHKPFNFPRTSSKSMKLKTSFQLIIVPICSNSVA